MSKKFVLAVAAALLLSAGAAPSIAAPARAAEASPSVTIDRARIDAALKAMVDSGRAVGVSALVWQDGQERYFGVAGMADREAGKRMRREQLSAHPPVGRGVNPTAALPRRTVR